MGNNKMKSKPSVLHWQFQQAMQHAGHPSKWDCHATLPWPAFWGESMVFISKSLVLANQPKDDESFIYTSQIHMKPNTALATYMPLSTQINCLRRVISITINNIIRKIANYYPRITIKMIPLQCCQENEMQTCKCHGQKMWNIILAL